MTEDWIPLAHWGTGEQGRLVEAIWAEPRLRKIAAALEDLGISVYLVGGVVRDLVLGRPCKDIDLVVGCSPERLFQVAREHKKRLPGSHVPLDKERGTLRLCFSELEEFDLVALQGASLREDLLRRDLRINALALDRQGRLFDPSGGLEDLRLGILRGLSEENFHQDPLRVLRCLRFAAQLKFRIDEETWHWACQASSGLRDVSGERIAVELEKFFATTEAPQLEYFRELAPARELFSASVVDDRLLFEAVAAGLLTGERSLELGLALWLGDRLDFTLSVDELVARLRVSNRVERFLVGWVRGLACLRETPVLTLRSIFVLSKHAGPAFEMLARAAQLEAFPVVLDTESRKNLLLEACREGRMNWAPLPWKGQDFMKLTGRKPGPWLGQLLDKVEVAWASGELTSLDSALEFL